MGDLQETLFEFLRPPKQGSHWASLIQQHQEQEKLYEEAYDFFPYDKDPKLLGDPDLARARCFKKLTVIEAYLEDETMKDKNEAIKAQVWNAWMTARCTLMRAKVEEKYLFHTSLRLASCAGSAKYTKENWTEEHPWLKDFTNELNNFMNDVWKPCEETRMTLIASLIVSRSKKTLPLLKAANGSRAI
ncbi:MAG: hypothetical protein Q9192_006076 [Flavoplaca navasiana]